MSATKIGDRIKVQVETKHDGFSYTGIQYWTEQMIAAGQSKNDDNSISYLISG